MDPRRREPQIVERQGPICCGQWQTAFLGILLATTTAVHGQELLAPFTPPPNDAKSQWRAVDSRMTPDEYRAASRQNWRAVRRALTDGLSDLGVSETSTRVAGAIVGLAVGEPEIHLNRRKTLALQFKDAAEEDRSIFLNYNLAW
jgi:hypothetical protein